MLTQPEADVINALAHAWNLFVEKLPVEHIDDNYEFCQLIHAAQDKILARVGRRQMNAKR